MTENYWFKSAFQKVQRCFRADSRFAPSRSEAAIRCNDVSHRLGASPESVLCFYFTVVSTWKDLLKATVAADLPCIWVRQQVLTFCKGIWKVCGIHSLTKYGTNWFTNNRKQTDTFTNMDWPQSQHGQWITYTIMCAEVWEWVCYFIAHFAGHVINYPWWD